MSRFQDCLPLLLKDEGGYVDNPHDPGGATNLGVTIDVWSAWIRRRVTKNEMCALTPALVAPLYEANYWNAAGCPLLPPGVDYMVFDAAVNTGVGRAARQLQLCVAAAADGKVGPLTAQAVAKVGARETVERLARARETYYRSLPTFGEFGAGWLRRLARVRVAALGMAR